MHPVSGLKPLVSPHLDMFLSRWRHNIKCTLNFQDFIGKTIADFPLVMMMLENAELALYISAKPTSHR